MTNTLEHNGRESHNGVAARIPSLDGIRALAIGLVLFWHFARAAGMQPWLSQRSLGDGGAFGVRIFFVLSGFLITTVLVREELERGRFSICAFYIRRARRILPAFAVFVLAMAVSGRVGLVSPSHADLWHALTMTMNFHAIRDWSVGHLWSLSVEEQFYLLWPLCMLVVPGRRILVLFATLASAPVCRVGLWALFPSQEPLIDQAFPTIMDAVATGCLLACLRPTLESSPRYLRVLESSLVWSLLPLAFLIDARLHWFLKWAVGETAINVAIAVLIHRAITHPADAVGRWLNARPIAYLGTLSYSLYLWQQPFLTTTGPLQWIPAPLNLVLAFAAAWLSFTFVELPFRAPPMPKATAPVVVPPTSLMSMADDHAGRGHVIHHSRQP